MITGITFSCFDLLHAGHILMLKEAKRHCDYLICGLQTDPSIERPQKNKPVQSLFERYVQLNAVGVVDEVIPYTYEVEIIDILLSLKPDVRFLGSDYRDVNPDLITGMGTCRLNGIEVIYLSRDHGFSSSELRRRIKGN